MPLKASVIDNRFVLKIYIRNSLDFFLMILLLGQCTKSNQSDAGGHPLLLWACFGSAACCPLSSWSSPWVHRVAVVGVTPGGGGLI